MPPTVGWFRCLPPFLRLTMYRRSDRGPVLGRLGTACLSPWLRALASSRSRSAAYVTVRDIRDNTSGGPAAQNAAARSHTSELTHGRFCFRVSTGGPRWAPQVSRASSGWPGAGKTKGSRGLSLSLHISVPNIQACLNSCLGKWHLLPYLVVPLISARVHIISTRVSAYCQAILLQ